MALQSFQRYDDGRYFIPTDVSEASPLAEILRDYFATHRPWFNETVKFNEATPATAMTLSHWRQPTVLASLMATYGDHIYRNRPHQTREYKPLKSLWAQWYIGLLVPPMMMALLSQPQALSLDPAHIYVDFHETGRAACFWIEVEEDRLAGRLSPSLRLEKLITNGLTPIVDALEASGDINGKLIWSNTGYLVNWFIGELKSLIDDDIRMALINHCFFEKQLSSGQDNPLYRTVIAREGILVRRTCCQRYRLPDVQGCGDCTLK